MDCDNAGCTKKALDWKVCLQCFKYRYCSEDCLEEDWFKRHEIDCLGHDFRLSDFLSSAKDQIKSLGNGRNSETHLVQHRRSKAFYALKKISKSKIPAQVPLEFLLREISIHKSLDHKNIIKLYDQLEDDDNIYIVLEYADNCSLSSHLKCSVITEQEASNILKDLCLGLKYIHEKGVVHKNLRPDNILLTSDNTVKISDFRLSSYSENENLSLSEISDYTAPEVRNGQSYSYKADIWSLGVILYEMLHSTTPFENCGIQEKIQKISKKDYNIDPKLSCPLKRLLLKLLSPSPDARPDIIDILKSTWFSCNFNTKIRPGNKIVHNDYGLGTISIIQGIVCTVKFNGFSKEFIVQELLMEVNTSADPNCEESIDMIKNSIEVETSIARRCLSPKLTDLSPIENKSLGSNEFSTMSAEALIGDSDNQVTESKINNIQTELKALQKTLEKGCITERSKVKKSKSIFERLFSGGCVKRD